MFAIVIGVANLISNDFGTSSAQKLIYKARLFELVQILLSAIVLSSIFKTQKKLKSKIIKGSAPLNPSFSISVLC